MDEFIINQLQKKITFLILGDLHGNIPKFYFKNFDAIIAPGDFCSDAPKKYMFQALREKMHNPASKAKWYDLVGKKDARKMIQKSLSDGREILEQLNSYGAPVYIVPGNWDWTRDADSDWNYLMQDHYKSLIRGLNNIFDAHHRIVDIGDYQIIGHGISSGPEYPQYKEDLESLKPNVLAHINRDYKNNYKNVDSLFEKSSKPVIFLSHNVPFNTSIDEITDKESPRHGSHYGSLIAREMIDKYHPIICIGGHMHEHFGKDKLGKTVIINAGYGSYVNTLLEINDGKIKKIKFFRGK